MPMLDIVHADPQLLVRAGLRQLLEKISGVNIVGEAADGRELLDQIVGLHPQVVICELALPEVSGLDIVRRVVRHMPDVRVLFLSAQTDPGQVRAAIKAGAAGFLSKFAEPVELELAVRAVARGQTYLSPSISRHAIERRRAPRGEEQIVLSPRQREVLRLIGRGKSTKEIAALLGIGSKTVETHRFRLMQALGLPNTHALVHFAVKALVDAGDER